MENIELIIKISIITISMFYAINMIFYLKEADPKIYNNPFSMTVFFWLFTSNRRKLKK
tara:strand:- start:457 stop:630 length:174 start_codon:yes stop_codon:yes gene_type:complete